MTMRRGLYELLITEQFEESLRRVAVELVPERKSLRAAEAGDRLALHLARLVESFINELPDGSRVEKGTALVRALVDALSRATERSELSGERPVVGDAVLHALVSKRIDGTKSRSQLH